MLRKETISDDTLMPYSNMDVYLTSPQPNLNVITQQKSMNPMANIAPPNYNVYINNKQMENFRGKQCSMRQIIPNHNNNGVICNRTTFNSNSTMMNNNNEGVISMGDLYMIAENYNPIEKLTLPVNNGMLCNPFILPNNQITTEVEFNLTEESLKEIVNREDLDIVLLSRLTKETSFNLIIWPLSISISVNNSPVVLDTKMFNKIPVHLPQYIKKECVIGRNVVKFDVMDISKFNAAMFQFQIYMVHRPTIEHAKKLAISHAFESEELTFKLLHDICMNLNREFVNVSTICPITGKRIEIAARLKCCTHLQPFDLIAFLKIQARWMLTSCPLCYNSMPFNFNGLQQNIVIDKILQQIFDRTPTQYQLVQVHMNGQFTPVIMHSGMEFNAEMQNGNNIMMSNRHNSKHFAELNSNTIMHSSQPMPPVYRPPDQNINFQMVNGNPHRVINTPFNNVSIDSRSMLDLHPADEQALLMSMQPNMKYPHQTLPCVADKPLTKKPVKRKIPRKATPKTKIDVNPNLVNNANNMSNGAITPPSTRTSSVASTSSPDSLNVPHLNHKRPPSIDLLPSTVLSDCHLSIGDDPNLFSTTPISQMNNLSFSHPTQTQQFQQQQFQQFQQQQQIQQQQIQQQQIQQQQIQQQQIQQQQIQQQQIQQQQIQQQQIQQQQIQQQQLQQQLQQQQIQQQHYHHLYQLPPEQKSLPNWPIPEQISMQQRSLQQQPQHHAQLHQQIQHIPHPQIPHIQQPKLQQSKVQEFNQQQILTQQPSQPQQLHHLPQQPIQHKSQQLLQDQQQFNGNLPSHPLYQNQSSYPNSVKQESMHCVPSNNPESLSYPLSVKQDILNYSPSLKQESINYPPSVKQESINYPPSVKQDSLNYPPSVKQESINYPPSVKQESINYPSSVKTESLQYQNQSSNTCLDNTNNNFTHQQLSNSSCSSLSSFIERILTTYEPVPEVHECSWLDGFNLIEVNESMNLSDLEEF